MRPPSKRSAGRLSSQPHSSLSPTAALARIVSRNTRSWWDNSNAYRLGYDPKDNAETYAAEVENIVFENPLDEALHGGQYVSADYTGKPDWIA